MELFGIPVVILVLGLLGYVWKLRKTIVENIPGKKDDKVLDTIEGITEYLEIDMNKVARKSRGRLKKEFKKEMK